MNSAKDPASELMTMAGSQMVALQMISALAQASTEQDQSASKELLLLRDIREIAQAALEHRKPRISGESVAALSCLEDPMTPLIIAMTENLVHENSAKAAPTGALSHFTPGELAWGCFFTTTEGEVTVGRLLRPTCETEALASALGLAANRRGEVFSRRRAQALLALVQQMTPQERAPYIDLAARRRSAASTSDGPEPPDHL
jgi:hypothetical protein